MTFIGNHDVTRIASKLENTRHLEHALAVLLTVGGTPSVYAGDESGYRGVKEERVGGDDAVRPEFTSPLMGVDELGHDIFRLHQYLIGLRRRHPWLHTARTSASKVTNTQYVYQTRCDSDALLVALNIDDGPMTLLAERVRARRRPDRRGIGCAAARRHLAGRDRAARLADHRAELIVRTVAPASPGPLRRRRTCPAPRRSRRCRPQPGRTTSSTTAA